jgi:hypothetical protein
MFTSLTYLHIYDNEYDDKEADEITPWVVDICELMKQDDTSLNVEKKKITINLPIHPPK